MHDIQALCRFTEIIGLMPNMAKVYACHCWSFFIITIATGGWLSITSVLMFSLDKTNSKNIQIKTVTNQNSVILVSQFRSNYIKIYF